MRRRRPYVSVDNFTFPFALKACSRLRIGVHLHSVIVKMGFDSDVYVRNSLISVYGGCGRLVDARDEIHEFFSGDDSHLESLEVRKFLQQIITDIRVEGYEPYTSNVFHDIEDEEKEQSIGFHSEKLAVAFALVSFTDSRRTIRIMKNLRTCRDCHSFMKRVSRKFDREIIVRDRNRFHHFRDGACSCQDYW
ncbi:Pentatricopeptide repeat-containing protein At4g21065 [Linum grandiflorum]